MNKKELRFETKQLHIGQETPDIATGARAVPIYQTTSYVFKDCKQAEERFSLSDAGNIYGRLTNSTQEVLENRIAALEGGVGALAVASGAAAITYALISLTQAGDHIVAAKQIYGGSYNLLAHTLVSYGITTTFVDGDDPENFKKALKENTKAIFIETLGNPNSSLIDIEAVAKIAHDFKIPLIVDNTFASPYLFRPIEHGADLVVYSTTKYLAGHGNVMGGVVVDSGNFKWKDNPRYPLFNTPDKAYHDLVYANLGKEAFCTKAVAKTLRDLGGCMSPFNAYMTLLGLETLSLRMKKHVENARALANFLNECEDVEWVSYAELPDNPNYELAKKYFPNGFGGLYTFGVKGGVDGGKTVINNIKLFIHVTNFADSRSLLTHPASTTHAQMSKEEQLAGGVKEETIRMSVGLEDVNDLIADLKQAFAKIKK